MTHKEKRKRGYQSLFWPMLLIGVGTAWLLTNIGVFTGENISVLFQLWPLLLIFIGIDLIFGRSSPSRGGTIGLAFVGFILAIMYVGPSIGLGGNAERNNTYFDLPLDGAETLELNINAGIDNVTVNPLVDSNNLIEGNVWHYGELIVDATADGSDKVVDIKQDDFGFSFNFGHDNPEDIGWNFTVNPEVALALDFDGGVGETIMNLSDFTVTDLKLDLGVGSLDVSLPDPAEDYNVDISGGVGEVKLDIPDNVPVQIDVSTGVGDVNLPASLIQISGDDGLVGQDGLWQTEGFETATNRIFITFDGGVGSLEVR